MKTAKRILTGVSLGTMSAAVLMLLLALFGLSKIIFSGVGLNFLLSFAIISIASAFSINACNILSKRRVIATINLSLLGVSTFLFILTIWIENFPKLLSNMTYILAIATIFFSIIVSLNLKLGKRQKVLQILTYTTIIIIDIMLSMLILGVELFEIDGLGTLFVALCLVTFGLLCATAILGKKAASDNTKSDKNTITITKEEYNNLKNRITELENEINQLKNNK
ncbi:MAG: hypothetical protein IJA61_00290 [Clostridia bacterium]|nr:hypothetical protein [Clostridia bacterium]